MVPASHLQSFDAVHVRLRDMSKAQGSNVDGRCDGEEDECQGSEGRNKLPRQSEGRCVARVLHAVEFVVV